MKLYPVLHCGQVKVLRKINFYSLVTTMYSGGVPRVSIYFLTVNKRQEVKFFYLAVSNMENIRDFKHLYQKKSLTGVNT